MSERAPLPIPPRFPGISQLAAAVGKPFWIIDLEATTGDVKDASFGIIELGYVLVSADGSCAERGFMVDAGLPISPFVTALTGIVRADYRGAATFEQSWPELRALMAGSVISGFGVHDLDCKALFREAESRVPGGAGRFTIDSLDARSLWKIHSGGDKGQLFEVAEAFGHTMVKSHRALADALAAAHALEGLVGALGVKAVLHCMRKDWNPLISMDQAALAAEKAALRLSTALKSAQGAGSFPAGLALLEERGIRPHLSAKGLSWWIDGNQAKLDSAPATALETAAWFGCELPAVLDNLDSIERCAMAMAQSPTPIDDATAARVSMCRSAGTASAARAKAIRVQSIPPWSGVDPDLARFARELPPGAEDEREALDQLRKQAPALGIHSGHPGLSACAASLSIERGLGSRPEMPRTRSPRP